MNVADHHSPSDRRLEIVISGSGGQGVILAGKLLAETAAVYGGMQTVMVPCFGPEVRGGFSAAELIIDSNPIDYPRITRPDVLIALSEEGMTRYAPTLRPKGLLLVNETLVKDGFSDFKNTFAAPFTSVAIKKLKTQVVTNMIALGALSAVSRLVSPGDLKLTIEKYVPPKVLRLDRKAVDMGFEMASGSCISWQACNLSTPDTSWQRTEQTAANLLS